MCVVTEHLRNLITKQVNNNGLVVWYYLEGAYAAALSTLDLPDIELLRYKCSFIQLRWEIE